MYAVVIKGGKQYTVSPGTVLQLEKLEGDVGERINFDDILLMNTDGDLKIGTPRLEGIPVVGEIVRQYKAKKILVVKKKRRKGYRRINGHRQLLTDVKILSIAGISEKSETVHNKEEIVQEKVDVVEEGKDTNPDLLQKGESNGS